MPLANPQSPKDPISTIYYPRHFTASCSLPSFIIRIEEYQLVRGAQISPNYEAVTEQLGLGELAGLSNETFPEINELTAVVSTHVAESNLGAARKEAFNDTPNRHVDDCIYMSSSTLLSIGGSLSKLD